MQERTDLQTAWNNLNFNYENLKEDFDNLNKQQRFLEIEIKK